MRFAEELAAAECLEVLKAMDFLSRSTKQAMLIAAAFVCILSGGLLAASSSVRAEASDGTPWYAPVKAVAIIREDDQGQALKFPSSVFFDKSMDEIYVVSGGNGRINIYGSDYFPKISLGAGRGIDSPNGVYVASDGRLFVCQGRTAKNPPRLSIYNAAFFPLKEIVISDLPEAEEFIPNRVALGKDGKIYLAGLNFRGVMVLNREGEYLHWLKPIDKIWVEETEESLDYSMKTRQLFLAQERKEQSREKSEEEGQENLQDAEMESLPTFLRPKTKVEEKEKDESGQRGPVQVTDVVCDSDGHIYVLSEETSKVYVYSTTEELLFSFGQKGGSSGKLSRPRGLAVDEKRKCIYVVDYMRHTILIYNFAGRFLFEIGGKGTSPRWFNFPTALALNRDGNLIVADLFNQRVQVLDVQFEAGFSLFGPAPAREQEQEQEQTTAAPPAQQAGDLE